MQLADYPQAIAAQQRKLLEANKMLDCLIADLEAKEAEYEQAIAFDPELKNDVQRKAKKLEATSGEFYKGLKALVHNQKVARDTIQIELQQLLNQFSVAKLEARERIAQTEALTV